ncbi:MAG: hypothetical protein ACLQQB_06215 [Solirubrobacteraceae bacterium]
MEARAIVRYSIDGSSETANRARAALELEPSKFHKVGTGAYEATGPIDELIPKLRHLLEVLERLPGGGTVDHLWIYLDESQ